MPRKTTDEQKQVNTVQMFVDCTFKYDLTSHSITVTENSTGQQLLFIQPMPDNPNGFDLTHSLENNIKINNPVGVDFEPIDDLYESNQNAGY